MPDVLKAFGAVDVRAPEATEAYAILIEMAQYVPSMFEDVIKDVLSGFLSRMQSTQEDINSQTMALEFLLTLFEGLQENQFGEIQSSIAEFMALLMECLLQIKVLPVWKSASDNVGCA